MLLGLFGLIVLIVVLLLLREGLWTNLIALFNVMMAALLAMNYFEPLAAWITGYWKSATYAFDFVALWLLFGVFYTVLRLPCDYLSRHRVQFPKGVDLVGAPLVALLTSWILICFITMSLHVAPLGREMLFGSFKPEEPSVLGMYPDRMWLSYFHHVTGGGGSSRLGVGQPFDPKAEFLFKYNSRRAHFETREGLLLQPKELGAGS